MIADEFQKNPADQTARVLVLIDESGSMSNARESTIEAINGYFGKLAQDPGRTLVTVYKFDATTENEDGRGRKARIQRLFHDVEASQAKIDVSNYKPDGWTPLYDAIGVTVSALPADVPTLVVIQTDGLENSSTEWIDPAPKLLPGGPIPDRASKIKKLIAEREKHGWTFVFLGADLSQSEVMATADSLGVSRRNTMSYDKSASAVMGATLASASSRHAGTGRAPTKAFFAADEQDIKGDQISRASRAEEKKP